MSRFNEWCPECGCPSGPHHQTHKHMTMPDGSQGFVCGICKANCAPKAK